MRNGARLHHSRRGSALPVALILALVLATLGSYLLMPIAKGGKRQTETIDRERALTLAESALDVAVHKLRTSAPAEVASPFELLLGAPGAGISLKVEPVRDQADTWLISSICQIEDGLTRPANTTYLAIRLGEKTEQAARAIQSYARGRTRAVTEALQR